jgi:cell division protein FtsZ
LLTEVVKGPDEKPTLSDRLASLSLAPAPVPHPAMPRVQRPAVAEDAGNAQVWNAPGNVTIERRQPQLAVAMSQGAAPQAAEPAKAFVPTPPAMAPRQVRRMPNIEEFPVPAQNEVRARSGEAAPVGLQAQKKKVGFLERLASVAKGRKEEEPAGQPQKREPDFGQATAVPMPLRPAGAAPKGLRVERPSGEATVDTLAGRIEAQGRPAPQNRRGAGSESQADDDLEIPAFLRRRAT